MLNCTKKRKVQKHRIKSRCRNHLGEEAFIDLMEGRFKVTEAQLANRIDYDLYQDGKHTSAVFKVGEMLETPARLVVRRQSVTIH